MIQELVNTSVPAGLFPGTEGFCTVACTANMAPNVRMQLELMGGYRVLWKPGDPNAAKNPVLKSHYRLLIGGCFYNVLSRIAICGTDHQGRMNRLAHHIILENADHVLQGPAAVFEEEVFFTQWDQPPQQLPMGRVQLTPQEIAPMICSTWQQLAGDAGWAGEIVQAAVNDPMQPNYIIYQPGMDVDALLAEAFSLVPVSRKWDVTFSTHFDILPPKADFCTWRFCAAGSRTADEAYSKATGGIVIDLTAPNKSAGDGLYARMARTGITQDAPAETQKISTPRRNDSEKKSQPTTPSKKCDIRVTPQAHAETYEPARPVKPAANPAKILLGVLAVAVIIIQAAVIMKLLSGEPQKHQPQAPATAAQPQANDNAKLLELQQANDAISQKLLIAENMRKSQAVELQNLRRQIAMLKETQAAKPVAIVKTPAAVKTPSSVKTPATAITPKISHPPLMPDKVTSPFDDYVRLEKFIPDDPFKSRSNAFKINFARSPSYEGTLLLPCTLPNRITRRGETLFIENNESFKNSRTPVVKLESSRHDWSLDFMSVEYGAENVFLPSLKRLEKMMQYSVVRIGETRYQFIKPADVDITADGKPIFLNFPHDIVTLAFEDRWIGVKEISPGLWEMTIVNGLVFRLSCKPVKDKDEVSFAIELDSDSTHEGITTKLNNRTAEYNSLKSNIEGNLNILNMPVEDLTSAADRKQAITQLDERIAHTNNRKQIEKLKSIKASIGELESAMKDMGTLQSQQKWLASDNIFSFKLFVARSNALLYRVTVNYRKK